MAKRKDKERRLAYVYIVEHHLSYQEAAERVNVSKNTITRWAEEGKWKDIMVAKETGPEKSMQELRELLNLLVQEKIQLIKDGGSKEQRRNLADEISKISTSMEKLQREGTPTLRMYIHCVEMFMDDLMQKKPDLHAKILDFTEDHITRMAETLG